MEIILFNKQAELAEFFKTAFSRRNLIPIIGSGFTRGEKSRVGQVPNGREFQDIMIEQICIYFSEISQGDFKKEGYKFSEVANEFFKRVPKEAYKTILRNNFTDVELEKIKKKFLKINWPYIYTLNIDDAIENNSRFKPVRPYKKLSNFVNDLNCVFKMHGDVIEELTYDELPNIIFSEEQYIKSLERNSYILNFFQSDYSSKNIIFIGCSLDDELDLKYAISTSADSKNNNVSKIYVASEEPKGLRKSRLEDFGITKIVLVDDYQEFYKFLFEIYDTLRFVEEKPFDQFKNPKIEIYGKDLNKNKEYLLDVIGAKSSERSLPYFVEKREISIRIAKAIPNEVFTVISGKRFSGKTFLAKSLVNLLHDKDIYFFPSDVSFNNSEIKDLIKLERSYLIFDTNSIEINNVSELENLIPEFRNIHTNIIIFINKSDNLVNSAASMLTNNNYFNLNNKLTNKEVEIVNGKLSEIGLIKLAKNMILLDNCFRAFDAYKERIPFDVAKLTDKEFILSVILSSDGKVYSILFNLFEINKNEIDVFIRKLSPFIEYQSISEIELHQHSGYKISSNSSSWLFKILNEYKNKFGHNKVSKNIYEIVNGLIKNRVFNHLYKKIITFDNLNQIFSAKEKGEAGLILNIYEKLEPVLYNDNHFWLQRAKSILNLKRDNIQALKLASDYAKKAYYDSASYKFQINATTTLALIHGRIATIQSFDNMNDLEEAINWYYNALQETQHNKRYINDILEKTKRRHNDIKNICNFLLINKTHLGTNERKNAEYIINKVFQSSLYLK